jgi:hypothetical protein
MLRCIRLAVILCIIVPIGCAESTAPTASNVSGLRPRNDAQQAPFNGHCADLELAATLLATGQWELAPESICHLGLIAVKPSHANRFF